MPFQWSTTVLFVSHSFGAMPRSILTKISIWDPNLKIGPFTTLVKVNIFHKDVDIFTLLKQFEIYWCRWTVAYKGGGVLGTGKPQKSGGLRHGNESRKRGLGNGQNPEGGGGGVLRTSQKEDLSN